MAKRPGKAVTKTFVITTRNKTVAASLRNLGRKLPGTKISEFKTTRKFTRGEAASSGFMDSVFEFF